MPTMRQFKEKLVENDLLSGAIAMFLAVVLVVVVGAVYLKPPGRQALSFTTTDAATITGGEDVRVAGISVGSVSDVALRESDVEVTLDVEDKVRVGDRARIKVQLLTAVGGYYVNLIPGGRSTDAESTIPADRVTMPYTVADILQELPPVIDEIDGEPIDGSLQQVAEGFGEHAPAFRNAIDGLQTVADVMAKQESQINSISGMASEYMATFNNSRAFVFDLVRKVNIALSQYYTYRHGFSDAYDKLGDVLQQLGSLAQFYLNHSDELFHVAQAARAGVKELNDNANDIIIDRLEPMRDQLMRLIGPEGVTAGEAAVIEATKMCLPVAGGKC